MKLSKSEKGNPDTLYLSIFDNFKHEYLRSRAYIRLSLSSPSSSSDISSNLTYIEILVLLSWIPASMEFCNKDLLLSLYLSKYFSTWKKPTSMNIFTEKRHTLTLWKFRKNTLTSPIFRETIFQVPFYENGNFLVFRVLVGYSNQNKKWCTDMKENF